MDTILHRLTNLEQLRIRITGPEIVERVKKEHRVLDIESHLCELLERFRITKLRDRKWMSHSTSHSVKCWVLVLVFYLALSFLIH